MLVSCDNKGCYKENEALLDVSSNEVICSECGKSIKVHGMLKNTMKSLGQIKRGAKSKAFGVTCDKCKKITSPIKEKGGKYSCEYCKEQLKLNSIFENLLKSQSKESQNF